MLSDTTSVALYSYNLGALTPLLEWMFSDDIRNIAKKVDGHPIHNLPQNLTGMVHVVDEFGIPLGRGSSSRVMEGRLMYQGKAYQVALKRHYSGGEHSRDDVLKVLAQKTAREVKVLRQINHPNIMNFLGVAVDAPEDGPANLMIVSSRCEQQNIKLFLRRQPSTPRMPLVLGLANGLKYLHERGIVHGQVKPRNIAVRGTPTGYEAVLTDFSYAKITGEDASKHWGTIVFRYTPVEVARPKKGERAVATTTADVYAFSFVALFVISGVRAFADEGRFHILAKLLNGERPVFADHASLEMSRTVWNVLEECWSNHTVARPNISSVVAHLTEA